MAGQTNYNMSDTDANRRTKLIELFILVAGLLFVAKAESAPSAMTWADGSLFAGFMVFALLYYIVVEHRITANRLLSIGAALCAVSFALFFTVSVAAYMIDMAIMVLLFIVLSCLLFVSLSDPSLNRRMFGGTRSSLR